MDTQPILYPLRMILVEEFIVCGDIVEELIIIMNNGRKDDY